MSKEREINCLDDFIAWNMNWEHFDLLDMTEEEEDEWYEQYQEWLKKNR